MTMRIIYAGGDKLRIPAFWSAFVWHARTYRLRGSLVEVYDRRRQAWLPSIRLTTAAPSGRRTA